ncbi:methyl-accepting chemotaxis protein [Noviherbaspirillum galbum]|uniref:HAMP domain-containing protein n=1 Tax=Noviherbaspirillum galbum TaxID=2709383 RepID=A0A6B3SSJ3_9BURK|nr:methyl-accepting chemotaxis protein [Noviherbaspirillum galbum]NEX63920.1 HAMP domain-containing protein [Noviherbaspirillum galbum]
MNIRSLKIGARLQLGFGVLLAWVVCVLIAGILVSGNARRSHNSATQVANSKVQLANTMRSAVLEGGIAMRNVGLQYSMPEMQKEESKLAVQRKRFQEAKDKLVSTGLDDDENKILVAIEGLDKQTEGPFKEAIELVKGYSNEGAGKLISSKIDPLNQQAVQQIDKLVQLQQVHIDRLMEASESTGQKITMVLIITGIATVLMGGAVSFFTTRSITGPLGEALDVAKRVAAGKLGTPIEVTGKDEMGELLGALKEMDESLSRIVSQVRDNTEQIRANSDELSDGNANLSSRTDAQADAIQQTVESMSQLTSRVNENAANAQQANQLVQSASASALKGGEVVSRVVGTMTSIKDSSRKIVDIISVIDGIAFQTNILALNAAVEAARAGEQGRGFAVVASEVRNLAQRSAAAAKEIKELINDSVSKVESGNALVGQAGTQMEEIVTAVKHVVAIMDEISGASQEQSAGIEEVNQAVSTMDEMTRQNGALVQQAAVAAAAMQQRAAVLAQAVSAFHVTGHAGNVIQASFPGVSPDVEEETDQPSLSNVRLKLIG